MDCAGNGITLYFVFIIGLQFGSLFSAARGAIIDDFEKSQISWAAGDADVAYRVLRHQHLAGDAHSGRGSELIQITAEVGTHVHVVHPVVAARVIDELKASVWIKADRPGIQLLVRMVLPHTLDPQTRRPLTLLVAGNSYKSVGAWEQLWINNLPLLLSRQTWALQAKMGPAIDVREAYVDQLQLNVYGGVGETTVEVDDLDMAGVVPLNQNVVPNGIASGPTPAVLQASAVNEIGANSGSTGNLPVDGQNGSAREVTLSASTLMVSGRPMLPRIIEYQGEPLAFLKDLGFNVVRIKGQVTGPLLEEARQAGIRLIVAPPPLGNSSAEPGAALPEIDPEYAPVLAWHLGNALSADALPEITAQARQLRQSDRQLSRPIICEVEENLRAFSRQIDVLSVSRPMAGTSLELSDYGMWLAQRMQLARTSTPVWAVIETTPSPALVQQTAILAGREVLEASIDIDILRLQVYQALESGVRGIEFASSSRLDRGDKTTQLRAAALAILNAELELMEPWCVAGSYAGTVTSNDPAISGTVVNVSSGRLAMVTRSPKGSQFVASPSVGGTELPPLPGAAPPPAPKRSDKVDNGPPLKGSKPLQRSGGADPLEANKSNSTAPAGRSLNSFPSAGPAGPVNLTVPGVPDASEVYEITPVDVQPLRHRRVAGGTAVAIDDFPLTSAVLITADPLIVNAVRLRARELAPRAANLERSISAAMLEEVSTVSTRLPSRSSVPPVASTLSQAKDDLQRADQLLSAGDWSRAYIAARSATQTLGRWKREAWQRTVKTLPAPSSSPLAVDFHTLPEQIGFAEAVAMPPVSENLLPGGSFEDLSAMLSAGWRHFEHPQAAVQTSVELSPVAPYADRLCLRMHAAPTKPRATDEILVESPPLWVTSGPVGVSPGDVLCIRGRVRVLSPIRGAVDGLMIVDSLGGEALAERFGQTDGWREFVMYRAASQSGSVNISFVLTGLGDAWIDDVSIRLIHRGIANYQAGLTPPVISNSTGWVGSTPSLSPLPIFPAAARPPTMLGQLHGTNAAAR